MSQLLIVISLFLIGIHLNNGFSLPKIELQHATKLVYKDKDGSTLTISNPEKPTLKEITYYHIVEKPYPQGEEQVVKEDGDQEETTDSGEYFEIDQRIEPHHNVSSTPEKSNNDSNNRQKREAPLKRNRTDRFKRAYYRNWGPFTLESPRLERKPVLTILEDQLDYDEDVPNNSISDDYLEFLNGISIEDPDIVEYLEDDDTAKDDKSPADDAENNVSPADDLERENATENDFEKDSKPGDDDKDCEESAEKTSSVVDDILDEIHKIIVEQNSTSKPIQDTIDNPEDLSILNLLHEIFQLHDEPTDETNIKNDSNKPTHLNVLKGIFTNIIKDNIIINGNVPDTTEPTDIEPGKDKAEDTKKPESMDKPAFDANNTNHKASTENPHDNFTPTTASSQPDIEYSKNKHFTSAPSNSSNAASFGENSNEIDNQKSSTTEKLPIKIESSTKESEKLDHNANIKDHEATTKNPHDNFTPSSASSHSDIEYSKNKDIASSPSKSNADQNLTSLGENSQKSSTTEKNLQVTPVTPIEIESSTKDEDFTKTTPNPGKDDDPSSKKTDSADEHRKIDRVLDLVNNDEFWKLLGDLGGKYLESLIARTNSLIKEEVTIQVKQHLNALNKHEEKLVLEKQKDEVKEGRNKIIKNNTEPISENNEDTTNHSVNKDLDHKEHNDTLSINKHNLTENAGDNGKVTNVYVFYASDNIDEILKNIHQFANKNNGTNLYTFGSSQHGLNQGKDQDFKDSGHSNALSTDQPHSNKIYTTENTIKSTSIKTERTPEYTTSNVELIPKIGIITEQPTTVKSFSKDSTIESNPFTTKIYTNPTTEPPYLSTGTTTSDMKIIPKPEPKDITTESNRFTTESVAAKAANDATKNDKPGVINNINSTTESAHIAVGTTISDDKINPKTESTTEKNLYTTESGVKDGTNNDTQAVKIYTNPTTEPATSIGTTIPDVKIIPESTTVKASSNETTSISETTTPKSTTGKDEKTDFNIRLLDSR